MITVFSKHRIPRFPSLKRLFHVMLLAFMLGISNAILQEQRFIDDSATVIECNDEQGDDDPYD